MNRKAKKAMAMGMAALVAVTSVGGNTAEAAVKKLTKKATVTKSLTVKVGKTKKISVKKVPKKTKVTYKTNKKKIATVTKKGVVKGVKKGKAVITVKLKYKKKTITKKCNVTVKKATTTKVTATATPTAPAQVPTATPGAPTATPGTNATATPGTNATATPGANATETPGANTPTPTTPGAATATPSATPSETPSTTPSETPSTTPSETPSTTPDETETPEVVTKAAMTFTKDMAYGALKANNKVYVISQEAVKEVKDGAKEIEYTVIDLTTGIKEIKEAEIEEDVTFDEFTFDNEFTCSVDENTKTVTVVSETAAIEFVAYNTYSTENTEATLVDGDNTYVIAYDELYKVYKAEADAEVEVTYTKNGTEVTKKLVAGQNEVTIDGITAKVFVDRDAKTASVVVLKSGVVLK